MRLLTRSTHYRVGVQDFGISMSFIPSMPKDGFVIHDVRPRDPGSSPDDRATGQARGCPVREASQRE